MLRALLASHITASLWLLLVLLSAHVTGKSVAGIALEFYLLIFTTILSGSMTRATLDKVLGAEEQPLRTAPSRTAPDRRQTAESVSGEVP